MPFQVIEAINQVKRQISEAPLEPVLSDFSLLFELTVNLYMKGLDRSDWSFLRQDQTFTVQKPYSTGTIQTTQGSATVAGTGTGWTSALVGMVLPVANNPALQVTAVGSPTSLTLEAPWPTASLPSGSGYTLYQGPATIAPANLPVKTIVHLSNGWYKLREVSIGNIRRADPQVMSLGPGQFYGRLKGNVIWIWPTPDQVYLYRCIYILDQPKPTTLDTSLNWGLGDPYWLLDALKGELYLLAYQRTKDQNFKVLSDLARAAAEAQILELEDRDERNRFITTDVRAMPFSNEIPGEFDLPFLSADALTRVAW